MPLQRVVSLEEYSAIKRTSLGKPAVADVADGGMN